MPSVVIGSQNIPLTVNGTATGFVGIAASTVLLPGTKVILISQAAMATPAPIDCVVTSSENGTIGLRKLPANQLDHANNLSYGRTDCSAFLVADNSYIIVNPQVIPVEHLVKPLPYF